MAAPGLTAALSLLLAAPLLAQQNPPVANPSPYTLHVYANQVQVPALVLNSRGRPLPDLDLQKVQISLDGGPRFHPTSARKQGDDPLDLAVLLDVSGDQATLLRAAENALPALLAAHLKPADHVSLYALDCRLLRSRIDAPMDATAFRAHLDKLVGAPELHQPTGHHCAGSLKLWNSVAAILQTMRGAPGWHVLLVVSLGLDTGSSVPLRTVSLIATDESAAIFALRDGTQRKSVESFPNTWSAPGTPVVVTDGLQYLAAHNGGIVSDILPGNVPQTLERTLELLRDRYILEFPAPDRGDAGLHNLDIRIPRAARVQAAGAKAKILDPSVAGDPTTVRSTPSPAVFGTQRPQ